MSQFRFELATEADDADLRSILAATPMEGAVAVTFRREPSYFRAASVEGAGPPWAGLGDRRRIGPAVGRT